MIFCPDHEESADVTQKMLENRAYSLGDNRICIPTVLGRGVANSTFLHPAWGSRMVSPEQPAQNLSSSSLFLKQYCVISQQTELLTGFVPEKLLRMPHN
jgi:hypothetical protein